MRLIVLLLTVAFVGWLSLRALHRLTPHEAPPVQPTGQAQPHKPGQVAESVGRDLEKAMQQGMDATARELQKAEGQ